MATALVQQDGSLVDSGKSLEPVRARLREALDYRRRNFEGTWQSNLAFASGNQWMVYDRNTRTLRRIQDVDPAYAGRELYTADAITEYRETAIGELGNDDDRPQLLLQRDDEISEEYQNAVNRGLGYGWDYEIHADEVLDECDQFTLDLGTAAIRCKWEPDHGKIRGELPYIDGKPAYGAEGRAAVADAAAQGKVVPIKEVPQGRLSWEALSAFNILVPPGIPNERYFPWEGIIRPTLLSSIKETYGAAAKDLKEDTDIQSIIGTSTSSRGGSPTAYQYNTSQDMRQSRLRDHSWLWTYFERPSSSFRRGRILIFAGAELRLMDQIPELDYIAPDGTYRSGITYFHWWKRTGQFFSRGLVEVMKDGQRTINKRRTQQNEIIDRGMPYLLVGTNSAMLKRAGTPVEYVKVAENERPPQPVAGVGPGPWMQADVEAIREDLEHATGIKGPRLGENPANITTYSQLALVSENERTKRRKIIRRRQLAINRLVEDTIYDMRKYWGDKKMIALAGDSSMAEASIFNATKIPPFYIVREAPGASKPRSQAAELKLIEQVYQYSLNAQQPVPVSWVKDSLESGQALDLPTQPIDPQRQKAAVENHYLMQGIHVPVDYFDIPAVHIPSHRASQIQAILAGDQLAADTHEAHIQGHLQAAQANAAEVAQAGGDAQPETGPPPGQPGQPPAAPPGPLSQLPPGADLPLQMDPSQAPLSPDQQGGPNGQAPPPQ